MTTLVDMGFVNTRADPDVWRRRRRKEDGTEYYELLLVYVDDLLVVSHAAKDTLAEIGKSYEIKDGKIDSKKIIEVSDSVLISSPKLKQKFADSIKECGSCKNVKMCDGI